MSVIMEWFIVNETFFSLSSLENKRLVLFVIDILTPVLFLLIFNFILDLFIKVLFIFNFFHQFQFSHILCFSNWSLFFWFLIFFALYKSHTGSQFIIKSKFMVPILFFFLLLNLFSFSISPFNKKIIFIFYVNFDPHSSDFFILLLIFFQFHPSVKYEI